MQTEIKSTFMEKCITCLGETPVMHDLSEMFDAYLNLAGILKVCLHCETDKPYFPKRLCDHCIVLLKEFFKMKMRFINNEVILRNHFRNKKNQFEYESANYVGNELKLLNCHFDEDLEAEQEEEIVFEVVAEELKVDIHDEQFKLVDFSEHENDKLKLVHDRVQYDKEINEKKNVNINDDGFPDENANISEEPTEFKCSVCKIFFTNPATLNGHLFKHKNHKCDICNQLFAKKSYLTEHILTHKTVRDIACPMCPKAFKSRHTMRGHMKIHTNPRSYVCHSCGRAFNHYNSLKTHMKLKHSSKRDYLCLWCGMKFNLKASLDKHTLRKHSSKDSRKIYKCSNCDAEYLNKSNLDRHYKIKHSSNYQLVPCELCHKVFSDKSNLLRHKRRKHSEEVIEVKQEDACSPKVKVERYILNE